MGDLIVLLQHLNLSPVITVILAVILWLLYRLFDRFKDLEHGPLKCLENRLDDHDTQIAVNAQRITTLEDRADR